MTKHTMITFRLHRSGLIIAIVFAVLFALLIFAAGYLLGTRRGASIALAPPKVPKVAVPAVALPKPPAPGKQAPAAEAPRAEPASQRPVAVRVGVFPAEADAKALVQRLAIEKVTATIAPLPTEDGPTLYLVLVGRYSNRRDAAAAAAVLAEKHGVDTAVVPVE